MTTHALDNDREAIGLWKVFWSLVSFEAALIVVYLYGDHILWGDLVFFAYVFGILVTPVLLVTIPLEPTIGIVLMLIATGFDFLGRIVETTSRIRFHLTYFHLALFVTFVSTFLNLVLRRRTIIRKVDLWPPFILFLFILSYSLIYTPDFPQGSYTFVRVVVMGLISLIVIECVDKVWKVKTLMWSMILVPMAISILTIYQLLTQGSFYAPHVVKMATSLGLAVYRSTGTFDNPNKLACFLMIGIVIPFGALFVKRKNPVTTIIIVASLLASCVGILSTFSRAGWLSSLVGIGVIVAMHRKWSWFGIFFGVVVLMAVVLSIKIPQLWEVVFDRFGSIFDPSGDESSSSRLSLIKTGIWMWQDHPLFGIGMRGFPRLYYDYVDPNMPHMLLEVNEPHTIQVEILAEEGLIGFVAGTWLFMTVLFHGFRTSFRINNGYLRNAQIACTALMIAFVVNFTFATDLTNNTFWMTVGLMYAIPFVDKQLGNDNGNTAPVRADEA